MAEKYADKPDQAGGGGVALGRDTLLLELAIDTPERIVNFESAFGELGKQTVMLEGIPLSCMSVGINEASTVKEGA